MPMYIPEGTGLTLEPHPSDGTKYDNGYKDYGKNTSQGNNGTGVGGCGDRQYDIIYWGYEVDADHDTNHYTN